MECFPQSEQNAYKQHICDSGHGGNVEVWRVDIETGRLEAAGMAGMIPHDGPLPGLVSKGKKNDEQFPEDIRIGHVKVSLEHALRNIRGNIFRNEILSSIEHLGANL